MFDAAGRQTLEINPEGGNWESGYDPASNVVYQSDPRGQSVTNVFDALNRKTLATWSDGVSHTFAYDAVSNRTLAAAPAGSETFTYTSRNQVLTKTEVGGKVGTYSYDPAKYRTDLGAFGSGTMEYQWDAAGRQTVAVSSASGAVTTMQYDPLGRVTLQENADGSSTTRTWDPAGNLAGISNIDPSGAATQLSYSYDRAGHRTVEQISDGTITTWSYDGTYQLLNEYRTTTETILNGYNVTYTYDPVGNRLSRSSAVDSGTQSITYAYSPANRLTGSVSSDGVISTYLYDQSGNQTQVESSESGITYLAWDARNQLATVELPAGTVTMTYNADGQRVGKESYDGSTTGFLYDHKNLLGETDGMGGDFDNLYTSTIDQEYGNLISENPGGSGESYHQYDAQWSTQAMLDPDGAVQGPIQYQAFGLMASGPDAWQTFTSGQWNAMAVDDWAAFPVQSLPTNLGAWGQKQTYLDPETQLFLLGSGTNGIYYAPDTGRRISEDPIRWRGGDGPNLYRLNGNDPINRVDPSGHQSIDPSDPLEQFLDWLNGDLDLSDDEQTRQAALNDPILELPAIPPEPANPIYQGQWQNTVRWIEKQRAEILRDPVAEVERRHEIVDRWYTQRVSAQSEVRDLVRKWHREGLSDAEFATLRKAISQENNWQAAIRTLQAKQAREGVAALNWEQKAILRELTILQPESGLSALANAEYGLAVEAWLAQGRQPDTKRIADSMKRRFGTPAEKREYEQEHRGQRQEEIAGWSAARRFQELFRLTKGKVGPALQEQFDWLLSNLDLFLGAIGVIGAVQFIPIFGQVVDVLLGALGLTLAGKDVLDTLIAAIQGTFTADRDDEFEQASRELAAGLSKLTVDAATAAAGYAVAKGASAAAVGTRRTAAAMREYLTARRAARIAEAEAEAARGAGATIAEGTAVAAESAVSKVFSKAQYDEWMSALPTRPAPTTRAGLFQRKYAGTVERQISGGGEKFFTDGIEDSAILETKLVTDPVRSPFIPSSDIPGFLRTRIVGEIDNEFARIAKIIADPTNPMRSVRVIVSDRRAQPFFEALLKKYSIVGKVVVEPE